MTTRSRDSWPLLVPVALAAWLAATIVATWWARVGYAFDLEWMEGGILAHAWRALHGEPIYVPPGPDFIPMVYPPGYYWVLAAIGAMTELDHGVGRTVSAVGTLLACGATVFVVHRRLGQPLIGLLGAAFYLGCYEDVGAFFDLVRPDALAVGLAAWAIALGTEPGPRARALGASVLVAAFVVKHNMAAFGVPITLGLWAWRGRRPALVFAAQAAVPGLLFTAAMQASTGGHFLGYVLGVPASHPFVTTRLFPGLVRETGVALAVPALITAWGLLDATRRASRVRAAAASVGAVACAIAAIGVVHLLPETRGLLRPEPWMQAAAASLFGIAGWAVVTGLVAGLRTRRWHGPWVYAVGVAVVAAGISGAMRAHHGGFLNVLMPWFWALSTGAAVVLAEQRARHRGAGPAAVVAVLAAAPIALDLHGATLDRLVPTTEDTEAGEALVTALRASDGPVLSPFAPWLAAQAGHAPGLHLIALWDIRHATGPYRDDVQRILDAIRTQHYGTVVDAQQSMAFGVGQSYAPTQVFQFPPHALMPRSGWRRRPTILMTPVANADRSDPPAALGTDDPPGEEEP